MTSVYLQGMMRQIKQQITAFWKGLLDPDEQKKLLQDLQEKEIHIREQLQNEFSKPGDEEDPAYSAAYYQEILNELHQKMGVVKSMPKRQFNAGKWFAAASVLLVVGLLVTLYSIRQMPQSTTPVLASGTAADTIRLVNDEPRDREALLADGSRIILAPKSQIAYTHDYGKRTRTLYLTGKAEFNVAHDTLRPFTVWAKGYGTTALGTAFIVDAQADGKVHVKLMSGKVLVKSDNTALVAIPDQYLHPGDQVNIDTKAKLFKRSNRLSTTSESLPLATKKARIPAPEMLTFDETPLKTVFETISRKKGVQINTGNLALEGLFFTGTFRESESIQSMVGIVCQMNGFEYLEDKDGVTIIRKQEQHLPSVNDSITSNTNY